jgi:hypothetical protein
MTPPSDMSSMSEMPGLLGSYEANRETSGTSWQPGSTPMRGIHFRSGRFALMLHGFLDLGYQQESGTRADSESFTTSMFMLGARTPAAGGTFGFRFMGSLEPLMGRSGYPLLLQTGETVDGTTPVFDRQHPHDVLTEIAATFSHRASRNGSLFVYFGPIGEPAIGPTVFMHRYSSGDNPVAPISHHWLDSTHVAYGVLTLGFVVDDRAKLEASAFNGHEPDQDRWNVEPFALNSYSGRFTLNPAPNLSLQASVANLSEPEKLHPGIDYLRSTTSMTYNRPLERGNWQTTLAWGRNKRQTSTLRVDANAVLTHTHPVPGLAPNVVPVLVENAVLAESALRFKDAHMIFTRYERVEKDELFPPGDPRHSVVYDVGKLNVGYGYDLLRTSSLAVSVGVAAALHLVPPALEPVYGNRPTSFTCWLRLNLGSSGHGPSTSARAASPRPTVEARGARYSSTRSSP